MKNFGLFTISVLLAMSPLHMNAQPEATGRYAAVNGLMLYYEIHGNGSSSDDEQEDGQQLEENAVLHLLLYFGVSKR